MDILRFITAGNVDDGKSTLIGRLLYDTGNIKDDVLESVADSAEEESTAINLAFITDGLRAERQNKITIDVAYKYFTTPQRKYIITDAPGHFEFTRNLVTGASGVDAMIILIDAQNGITSQTRRHSLVASFLKIPQVIVAVNKMDIVGYDEQVFTSLKKEYAAIAKQLQLPDITFIPVSALWGDNVSVPSTKMEWYHGQTLMQRLENCKPAGMETDMMWFSVQYVVDAGNAGIGYAGKMLSGSLKAGDEVVMWPGGSHTKVAKILQGYEEIAEARGGENICLFLNGDIAAHRGNIIAHSNNTPTCTREFEATICWLNADAALHVGETYFLRINAMETACVITAVVYKIDINSFGEYNDGSPVDVNQFAKVKIKTTEAITYDQYAVLPESGRGIIMDAASNYTSAAFVI